MPVGREDAWRKFASMRNQFNNAKKLAVELCHDVGWPDLSEDFEDEINEDKLQLIYDELVDKFGDCRGLAPEYEEYSKQRYEI